MNSVLWLNIAIAGLGLGATLAAFGGDTWNKGPETLLKRVTLRGWVSLLCLISAFTLGAINETASAEISD